MQYETAGSSVAHYHRVQCRALEVWVLYAHSNRKRLNVLSGRLRTSRAWNSVYTYSKSLMKMEPDGGEPGLFKPCVCCVWIAIQVSSFGESNTEAPRLLAPLIMFR